VGSDGPLTSALPTAARRRAAWAGGGRTASDRAALRRPQPEAGRTGTGLLGRRPVSGHLAPGPRYGQPTPTASGHAPRRRPHRGRLRRGAGQSISQAQAGIAPAGRERRAGRGPVERFRKRGGGRAGRELSPPGRAGYAGGDPQVSSPRTPTTTPTCRVHEPEPARGRHLRVRGRRCRTKPTGIGVRPYDFSAEYGSAGPPRELRDDGTRSDKYPEDLTDPFLGPTPPWPCSPTRPATVAGQRGVPGRDHQQRELLGRRRVHWSFFMGLRCLASRGQRPGRPSEAAVSRPAPRGCSTARSTSILDGACARRPRCRALRGARPVRVRDLDPGGAHVLASRSRHPRRTSHRQPDRRMGQDAAGRPGPHPLPAGLRLPGGRRDG